MPGIRKYRFDSLRIIPIVIAGLIVLAVIAAVIAMASAAMAAERLPPGKPAGVRAASYNKRVEVTIFAGIGAVTLVGVALIVAPGNSTPSTK